MVGLAKARPNYFINNYVDDRSLDKSFEDDNGYAYDEYMRYDNSPSPYDSGNDDTNFRYKRPCGMLL